jgi:four helix bundle protein
VLKVRDLQFHQYSVTSIQYSVFSGAVVRYSKGLPCLSLQSGVGVWKIDDNRKPENRRTPYVSVLGAITWRRNSRRSFAMSYVKSFRDLQVYQLSRTLCSEIFELSKTFPADEKYSLITQIRRSSRSIGGQIAEAWGKRLYRPHFISKLTDADSEQLETQHWIGIARECDYITTEDETSLIQRYEEIGRMLQAMIDKADSFCRRPHPKR